MATVPISGPRGPGRGPGALKPGSKPKGFLALGAAADFHGDLRPAVLGRLCRRRPTEAQEWLIRNVPVDLGESPAHSCGLAVPRPPIALRSGHHQGQLLIFVAIVTGARDAPPPPHAVTAGRMVGDAGVSVDQKERRGQPRSWTLHQIPSMDLSGWNLFKTTCDHHRPGSRKRKPTLWPHRTPHCQHLLVSGLIYIGLLCKAFPLRKVPSLLPSLPAVRQALSSE